MAQRLLSEAELLRALNAEAEGASAPQKKTGYYARPEFGKESEGLYQTAKTSEAELSGKKTAFQQAQRKRREAEECLALMTQQAQLLQENYQRAGTEYSKKLMQDARSMLEQQLISFADIQGGYDKAYADYDSAYRNYTQAVSRYNSYLDSQRAQFEAWKGTIRDGSTVQGELDAIDAQISKLKKEDKLSELNAFAGKLANSLANSLITTSSGLAPTTVQYPAAANDAKLRELEAARALLQEEYDWGQFYRYDDLRAAEDFAEKSKYASKVNGKTRTPLEIMMGTYSEESSGWDDPLYEFINGNQEAGAFLSNMGASYYGPEGGAIGAAFGRVTEDENQSRQMSKDEVKIFNYLYATEGREAAHAYYAYLQSDLNARQREAEEKYWAEYAAENPVGSSVFSVATAPAKGLAYLGQTTDYLDDGKIDQNASYNKFSYAGGAIREQVSKDVEEKWGKAGSFAYQTGMSMADFLLNTAITGGNSSLSMTIMGTGAAADATIEAKDRGLSDDQAFALGTIAGAAEAITEKISIDALLGRTGMGKTAVGYILKNALAEGSEEAASTLINTMADILIAKDKSQWQLSIDAYVAEGKTEGEAFGLALRDQAVAMGLDALGGFLSGGIMGGGSAIIRGVDARVQKNAQYKRVYGTDVGALIDEAMELNPDNTLAQKLKKAVDSGKPVSGRDISRLVEANEAEIRKQQETAAETDKAEEGLQQAGQVDESEAAEFTLQKEIERQWDSRYEQDNPAQSAPEAAQDIRNDQNTGAADAESLSVAARLRHQEEGNGGTQYVSQNEQAQRVISSDAGAGAGVSHGGGQRYAGQSAGEQAGILASSTEQRRNAAADRSREAVARQNLARSLRLEKVSSLDLGVQRGTESRNVQVLPQEHWDSEMTELADRIYEETGKNVTYVVGRIQIRGSSGNVAYARGVITGDRIIVQADNFGLSMEQIVDHEAYHAKASFAAENRLNLNNEIRRHIVRTYSKEQFQKVLEKYIVGLSGVIDVNAAQTGEEYEAALRQIEEEIFADAYAGINAFGANADQFTEAVNEKMDQLGMGKIRKQENGVRETNGPPAERYSYAGENAANADLDALARAKEMQAAGVADETIRQETGWHVGMDGKWRWEIDDSGMEYSSRGDLGLRERRPEYARYRELLDKANRHALELSDEALTPEETAELQKLKNIWGGTFRKAGRITEDALPTELLSDYVKHDALLEAYPQLRKTRLRFADLPEGTRGQYDPEQDIITLSNKLRGKPQDTLIHEIQHVIQKAEGFAQGSSPEFWDGQQVVPPEYASEIQKAEDTVKKVEAEFHQEWPDDINLNLVKQYIELDNQLWGDGTDPIALQELADQMDQIEQLATESGWGDLFNDYYYAVGQLQMAKERAKLHRRASIDLYRNTAGEIEARDAASRRQLTAEQRRSAEPARADDRTVFVEGVDEIALAEMDYEYGPQMQSYFDPNISSEEINGNIQTVAKIDPVVQITGEEFAKGEKDLITQVEEFFAQVGNSAHNQQLGDVILDRRGIKSDIAHGIGRKKAAAFATVPDVISRGLIVDYQQNWKNRGYDTAVLAAPVTIGAEDHIAAVILTRSNQTNRFYVHEVLTMKNGATPFKTGAQKKGAPGGDAPSVLSILEKIRSVKNGTSIQERFSLDDEGTQRSKEQKTATKEKQRPVAESRPLIAKKDLRNTMLNLFSVPDGSRAELGTMIDNYADRLIKNGTLTEADRKAFFNRMYESGVMTMPANENYAEARSYLKDSRIYVPESVVADFGDDWSDIRRRAFASGIYLTRSRSSDGHSVAGIDVWNSDLAGELPGLFNAEETDQRSILERIVQVAEEGKDENMSLAEYTARLAESEHQSEAEFLDNMERQMDWALRTFAEKARLEVHLRDRTGRKLAQERQKHQESAQLARDRKELRELQEKTLKQLRWLSKNRNRAPEELRATWDEVLGDIDLYAIGAANEMRWSDKYNATWKDLAQMYKDAQKNDPNFMPSKELEMIVARLDGSKIADMDIGALQDLYKAAVGLRTEFYNRNNVINDETHRLFAEVYTDAKKEIESAPGGFTGNVADKFLNMDQLTPMNVLQRMAGWDPNSSFFSMAKQLERGERDMRAYHVKAQKMLQEFLTEHEDWVKIADGQGKDAIWYEVEVPQLLELHMGDKPIFGPTVKVYMTPAQKVHMYLESKNLDNLRHMTGGRTFVDKELYSKGKRQEALAQGRTIRLAPETVRQLVSDLTPEEMELARILDRYYNTFATQEINKISNILYGYDKAMGKNYAPIYTNRNYTKTEFGVFDTTAEGVGNLKGRQYAVNPSYNISAFDAFERHVDHTARFCGMAIPARNWTTLMNWREKNNSMGDVITHRWGEESKRYISDLITTLQGGDDAKSDTISSGLSKLQSNYITAIFGANPSIVLKQLGSIPMAGAYLDVKNLPTPAQIAKIDRSLISKYTQELEWRTMGYATPETKQLKDNPSTAMDVLGRVVDKAGGKLPISPKTKRRVDKGIRFVFGGDAITAMDGWAASTLWPWAENKVRREYPELEVGTQAQVDAGESPFYKKVAEEFENAITRSQSVSDEIHQSSLRKSKNPLTRTFTMFRSDSAQTYNTLRQKIGEAKYYARTGEKEQVLRTAKKAVGTAFMAMLLNAAWGESINFLMALWKNKGKYYRDDEDEMTFASVAGEMVSGMLGSFAGVVTGGEEILEIIGNILTGEKIYDIETPGMEQLNDLIDTVTTACGGMREVVAGGWDVLKNGGNLGEHFRKNSGKILGSIKDLAVAAATYLPGLPASNLEAYLVGAVKWLSPELGTAYEDLFSNVGKGDLSGLKGGALQSRVNGILSDRRVSESDETAGVLAALYEAGYKTAIPSDTPESVSIDGEKHTLGVYQKQTYDMIWASIVADALDEIVASDSFAAADQKSQAKMLGDLYTYAAEQAKSELFDGFETGGFTKRVDALKNEGKDLADAIILASKYGDATLDDYLQMTDAGMDQKTAEGLLDEIEELEPLAGEEKVQDVQRWRTCVDFSGNEAIQLAGLAGQMQASQFAKVQIAHSFGVTPDAYVGYYEIREKFDTDHSGSYSNAEVQAAIDSMSSYGLTNSEKAVLWQLATGSKSAKNNPYSVEVGEKVLAAK